MEGLITYLRHNIFYSGGFSPASLTTVQSNFLYAHS